MTELSREQARQIMEKHDATTAMQVAFALGRVSKPDLRWIPVSERKPKHGDNCLVLLCWDDSVNYVDVATWEASAFSDEAGWDSFSEDEVSHWMLVEALPEPPEA